MISIYYHLSDLHFGELMAVYEEGNRENAGIKYPRMDSNAALLRQEQDFYAYLRDGFFAAEGAFYAVLEEGGRYLSALRVEPYDDGVLVEALETRPDARKQGFGQKLLGGVVERLNVPVYSHVNHQNVASLKTHFHCGFTIIHEWARYIDGTVSKNAYTLCYTKE